MKDTQITILRLVVSRFSRRRARIWLLGALAMSIATMAQGQNLLANGGFDTMIAPWLNFAPENGTSEWSSFDANGAPGSGSVLVMNTSKDPMANGAGVIQSGIPVSGGEYYLVKVSVFVPSGQPITAEVTMEIQFYATPTSFCNHFIIGDFTPAVPATGVWSPILRVTRAPQAATCALVALETYPNGVGETFVAYFDQALLIPAIFGDGFDSGDTTAWSQTVP